MAAAGSGFASTTGSIQFSGQVVAGTCEISAGDINKTVTLPGVPTSTLTNSGDEAGATPFGLTFENCSVGDVAYSHFSPVENASHLEGSRIKNTGTASNVSLVLYEKNGTTPIDLSQPKAGEQVSGEALTQGDAVSLNYVVKYYSSSLAGPGSVNGQLTYDIAYK